jgi:hypothetical protein
MSTSQRATITGSAGQDAGQTPAGGAESGEVCIANISPSERRKRLAFGAIQLAIGLGLLAVLLYIGAARWWRLGLLVVFWSAAVGFFQWRDKTCIALVARNARKIGDRTEQIEDAAELAQVRRQARRVQLKALVAGALITLAALALPL